MSQIQPKETNYYVRTLIVILCLGIAFLITVNFVCVKPIGEINSGIITLLTFLVILVLSESFDNFSIGKILSLNREVKKKESQNQELERKNSELINQLISITSIQSQSSTNVMGNYYASRKEDQETDIDEKVVQELLDVVGTSPIIEEMERLIKMDLSTRGLSHDTKTDEVLIRHLAGTQLALQFESIHSVIFGSQIRLLENLNAEESGIEEGKVLSYVNSVFQKHTDSFMNWTLNQYLEFLYNSGLISKSHHAISITDKGIEYLNWMNRLNKFKNRGL